MAGRRASDPLLGPAFVAFITGLVEALLVWTVLGKPKVLGDVLLITAGSFAVAQAGDNLRYYGARAERLLLQRITYGAFTLTLIIFGAIVVLQTKRVVQSPTRPAGAVEYAVLSLVALPSWGVRAYLWWEEV